MTRKVSALLLMGLVIAGFLSPVLAAGEGPLRVLILTGRNNHKWKATTPVLQKLYQDSERFVAEVSEKPEEMTAEMLSRFDVIVSNWCAWPDLTGRQWGPTAEKAFLDFVRSGKGFALFHAASATFHDWPEFQQMAGATWKLGETGHGPIHEFTVRIANSEHPVTRGLRDFVIRDELWHKMGTQRDIEVLCDAHSSKDNKGSGQSEPVVICTEFGKGRCFYNILGHDAETMKNPAWRTLMLRGTEWAATGKVTIPASEEWPDAAPDEGNDGFSWEQSDSSLALMRGEKIVWRFNFGKESGRAYFHPVCLADGTELTWDSPPDHPWHHGLWFSWKFINGLNYWEEDRKTGQSAGLRDIVDVRLSRREDFSASINVLLDYHPPGKPVVLRERRIITISAPDADGRYRIDWISRFQTNELDVLLDRTPIPGEKDGKGWGGYAGLSVRIAKDITEWRVVNSEGGEGADGHGKSARWMDFTGKTAEGGNVGIAIFDDPDNVRHPSPWYVSANPKVPFGYFSPAPLFDEPLTLSEGKTLTLRYRVLVHPGRTDAEALESEWKRFSMARRRAAMEDKLLKGGGGSGRAGSVPGSGGALGVVREVSARARLGLGGRSKKATFMAMDLSAAEVTTDKEKLADLFEQRPAGSGEYRLREEVLAVRNHENWSEGAVYYNTKAGRYYVLLEPEHPKTKRFYGPFEGEPWKRFEIPEPVTEQEEHLFAIHLVAEGVNMSKPGETPLAQLRLDSEPLFTEEDIVDYDWDRQIIQLKPGVRAYIPKATSVWGIPFVVTAGGKRCYMGAFYAAGSSFIPKMPVCHVGGQDRITIEEPPVAGVKDQRRDGRILRALKEAGVLTRRWRDPADSQRDTRVEARMNGTVDLSELKPETTFGEALETLRTAVDPPLNIVVYWRDLRENANIDRDTTIEMRGVSGMTLGSGLSVLLRAVGGGFAELSYIVQDGLVVIATRDTLRKGMETRVYKIRDLYRGTGPYGY